MSVNLKQYREALGKDTQTLKQDQKIDLVHKSAYHAHKQKDEFKSMFTPYQGLVDFWKDFIYTPSKATVRMIYGLYNLAKAPSDAEPGAKAIYGLTLIARSLTQIHTATLRAVTRGLATLYSYLKGEKETPKVGIVNTESKPMVSASILGLYQQLGVASLSDNPGNLVVPIATHVEKAVLNAAFFGEQNSQSSKSACPLSLLNSDSSEEVDFSNAPS